MASEIYRDGRHFDRMFPDAGAALPFWLDLRMYFPQELDALLAYNGLPVEAKYADYDRRPFGPAVMKQLIVCRPAS